MYYVKLLADGNGRKAGAVGVVCRWRSTRLATALLKWGAIPASRCMLVTFAALRQPVLIQQQSCRAGFNLFGSVALAKTEQAYWTSD